VFSARLAPDHPELLASQHRLACWHWRMGARQEAAAQLAAVAARFVAHESADDGAAVACYNDLASVLQDLGRLDEAERWLQRSSELTTRLFGERRTADMLRRVARLHFDRGRAELAETFALRAVAAAVRTITPAGGDGAALRAVAGEVVLGFDHPRGRAALLQAFAALRAHHGPGEYELAEWLRGLGVLAAARGQSGLKADLLREALQFRCRLFGADCPVRAGCLRDLAECLRAAGQGDEAAGLEAEAEGIEVARRKPAPEGERGVR
jgi:hypothetical protein